mmetsp:Transcript_19127/g.24148  ORF Transcript_19127/g.24148 Transcript_19127/m.24148 type:complete len:180 (-) Transcript_19127:2704-3243(-)
MGHSLSKAKLLGVPKEVRVLMVGLDSAGKTTVLYHLKLGKAINTTPTLGYKVETVRYQNIAFTVWDVGGQSRIRPLWRHYNKNSHAIVFVLDSNDKERISEAKEEIQNILSDVKEETSLLVLANKQDLCNAMGEQEIYDKLNLQSHSTRKVRVQLTCAVTGEGLSEALEWLYYSVKNKR